MKRSNDTDQDFTKRVMMALVADLAEHMASAERMRVMIAALAAEHGISVPAAIAE